MQRAKIMGLVALLVMTLACMSPKAFGEGSESNEFVAQAYEKAISLIERGDYKGAQAEARKLMNTQRFKKGDIMVAGSLRGIANEFAANKQVSASKGLLSDGHKLTNAKGGGVLDGKAPHWVGKDVQPPATPAGKPFNPDRDLKRIRNGNQASILKVMDFANSKPLFVKYMFGAPALDGVTWAPISDEHRAGIWTALGIDANGLDQTANMMLGKYSRGIPVQGLALLGVIGSTPGSALTPATRGAIEKYLIMAMWKSKGVVNKRQALLALAMLNTVSEGTVNEVVRFYGQSYNPYEVFPVSQFFEYHQSFIKGLASVADIKARVSKVDSFYTPQILSFL